MSETSSKVYKIIWKLSSQLQIFHRRGFQKKEFFRAALVACEWTRVSLSTLASRKPTNQKLDGRLLLDDGIVFMNMPDN